MAMPGELARANTPLGGAALAHVRRLLASWQVLADLCFADLLFLAAIEGEEGHRFVVLGQVRPTTDQTLYTDDMVGTVVGVQRLVGGGDRKSTRLNSSHGYISYAVFCLKKKKH